MGLLAVGTATALAGEPIATRFQFTQTEMAVPVRIVLYAPDNATASAAADAAFARFHELNAALSDYDPESELRKLCGSSSEGKPVRVSDDLWRVLVRAKSLSELSGGAFDVTIGPLVLVWRNARRIKELPTEKSIETARAAVGYSFMRLHPENQSVELLKPNMRLDLGGLAKGYAVDEALAAIRKHGITRMMVEAGGNIGLGDPPPDAKGWRIGIARPDPQSPPRQYLELSNVAVSTSGDMWQYAIINEKRYSHLVDPRTGMALSEHCSVAVIGPDGLSTDGVSSAIAILGPEKGLKLLEQSPNCSALMIRMVDGKEEITQSKNWPSDAQ
jgi:thiamine biosynthesis lipoprotein